MTGEHIIEVSDADDLARGFAIRHAVFCVEQGVSDAEEFDGRDDACRHYLAIENGVAVGAARLRDTGGGEFKIERVAVLSVHRGKGYGRALMRRTIADAAAAGATRIAIHAQCHALAFYTALGFAVEGEVFEEAGIAHRRMVFAGPGC